ncbi:MULTISPECIES: hypothetical protein [Methylobacterium]|uniref:hypothetical protein n=1 Tax=Methylobacterium TaxID=407 RepID=UPI0014042BC4|nr:MULTISPECIES: hypothetical protein [Methylobacterium]MDR7035301.1 hypothetical protein [Methylobacterium sp. BE186]
MDGFYRGVEASLLALSLALGIGAFAVQPRERPPEPASLSVTLPMLSVTAGGALLH